MELFALGDRIQQIFNEKKYYEFTQQVKALAVRRFTRKQYNDFEHIIKKAVDLLVTIKNRELILDLGEFYIQYYKKYSEDYSAPFQEFILKVFINGTLNKRKSFLENIIRLTEGKIPKFFLELGKVQFEEGEFDQAYVLNRSFLHSENMRAIKLAIEMLLKYGNKTESDLIVFRTILEFLVIEDIKKACIISKQFQSECPLSNFGTCLIQAINIKSETLFRYLVDKYKPSLNRDPSLMKYLNKICQKVFGSNLEEETGLMPMMNNLMKMFSAPPVESS